QLRQVKQLNYKLFILTYGIYHERILTKNNKH
ncbi:unnamed protein product, partial [marine sediment metagenome]